MSKAVICDICRKAIAEPSATHMETTWAFVACHYALCPTCMKRIKAILHPKSKEASVAAPTSNEHSEKASPNVPTAIVPEERMKCK